MTRFASVANVGTAAASVLRSPRRATNSSRTAQRSRGPRSSSRRRTLAVEHEVDVPDPPLATLEESSTVGAHVSSPFDEAPPARRIDGSLRYTREWAEHHDIDPLLLVAFVEKHGGHCDCEVVFNVDAERFAMTPRTGGAPAHTPTGHHSQNRRLQRT